MEERQRLAENLQFIYGEATGQELLSKIESRIKNRVSVKERGAQRYDLSAEDVVLITYADQFQEEGRAALKSLHDFCFDYLKDAFNTIHILPFFPYSSDDGFSVIDYFEVNPQFGTWRDLHAMAKDFRLMVDGVFNHVSQANSWFQNFLKGKEPYKDYFIKVAAGTDLSKVVRPRALPLLTEFETDEGAVCVWTTFSKDQVDLNFASTSLFLEIVDVLLFYVDQGAGIIRIDAVPFLWKEIGTDCIHRPQTHALVKAFRAILDMVASDVLLITESNVPFKDNIPYLGEVLGETDDTDEAQLVYQFSLAPLILHTFLNGNARKLSDWVASLPAPHRYFNFIASHDGIGLNPALGILSPAEIEALITTTHAHGGKLSYKKDTDGEDRVYELNITLYDFLNDPDQPHAAMDIERYLASQAIMLALAGVPGVYVHSLFGSRNCMGCFAEDGQARAINREKFSLGKLKEILSDPGAREAKVFERMRKMLTIRRAHPAFDPFAHQAVVQCDDRIFGLLRRDAESGESILCYTNVSDEQICVDIPEGIFGEGERIHDLLMDREVELKFAEPQLELQPYENVWLCEKM